MKINNENIDELMFQLLEGEIQGEERALLLDAIHSDKNYNLLWQAWQRTILNSKEELVVMNTGKLLKKENKAVILWWKYCAAASVVLVAGLGMYYVLNHQEKSIEVAKGDKPKNPKLEIIKVPSVDPVNKGVIESDSTVSFRQKVRMMADKDNTLQPKKNEPKIIMSQENQQPIIVKQDEMKLVPERAELQPAKSEPGLKPGLIAHNQSADDHIITSVYTESKPKNKVSSLNQVIGEKKNLLTRIFSKPKFTIVNDSNRIINSKIIIENKEYKIIAGF